MTFDNRPTCSRWALILLGAAMLTLAGCGRKAGLDLPPDAPQLSSGEPVQGEASKPSVFNPSYGSDAAPAAAKGRKKPFILDPLLGN